MKQLKQMAQRGLLDPEQEDPFALFVASTNIRYCYYNETQNILGNTYGMAVLQVRPCGWQCTPAASSEVQEGQHISRALAAFGGWCTSQSS